MSIHPLHADIGGRPALEDPAHLAALREEIFATRGADAPALLYALGFVEGMVDGLRVAQAFAADDPRASLAGPGLPLLFAPGTGCEGARVSGVLEMSLEARIHRAQGLPASESCCYLSAGYAAGWYGEILREPLIVREVECVANGGSQCRFVARSIEEWQTAGDPWVDRLLECIDLPTLRAAAGSRVAAAPPEMDGEEPEGEMFGGFDSMSPAVHVWGPVMILPYSGGSDGEAAIEMVSADLGSDRIEVMVVDITGVKLGPVEADGLTRFLDHLETLRIEVIVVGLRAAGRSLFQDQGRGLAMPMLARDVSQGIAFAFQLAHGPSTSH